MPALEGDRSRQRQTPEAAGRTGGPQLALVVDRDPALTASMLESLGYRVRTAPDCQEGLCAASEDLPDLLVLGLDAGGMAPHQFLGLIRKYPRAREIPVVAVVGAGPPGPETDRLARMGVRERICRPFPLRLLRDTVARAHPEGPARAGGILGTSSSFELPAVEGPDPGPISLEHPLPAEVGADPDATSPVEAPRPAPLEPAEAVRLPEDAGRSALVMCLRVVAAGVSKPVELEKLEDDRLVLRTRRFRLARGEEPRLEVQRGEGKDAALLRFLTRVTASRWLPGGGRATVQVVAAIPLDAVERLRRWLEG